MTRFTSDRMEKEAIFMEKYKSIGCSYYDQIEAFAVKRTPCDVLYNDGEEKRTSGLIIDVFAKDGAEYLRMENGTLIRLDHLVSINGEAVTYSC